MGGLSGGLQSVDSADENKSSGSSLSQDQKKVLTWNKISLEEPTIPLSGESRYLTPLWVSRYEEPREEPYQSDSAQFTTTGFELIRAAKFRSYHLEIKYKIRAALKLLTLREQHVLIQFWSPRIVGKHQLLTTDDQPFGLGVAIEELCFYRKVSERNAFLVDKDHEEDDVSPPARVFRQGLPEWTFDITNYKPEDFPQQECAILCNLYGYLALPVFDSTTGLCVGVLELLTSSNYMSYDFEVQQVHEALKMKNLTSPQAFDRPPSKIPNENKDGKLDKVFDILKIVCDIHSLPLAQTWAVSPSCSFVSHEKVIKKSCSSFDARCIGKVCMSTADLPFHVRDLGMWHFRKACREQHLDKSCGFVGRALLAHGSCYCQDITELTEEEYPLVHKARMSGLTGCFTIFLHSVDDDYVLEFFLLSDSKNGLHVLNLVQTLKQRVEVAFGFELGEISLIEVIGPPRDVSYLSSSIKPHTIQISSTTMANTSSYGMGSSDSESFLASIAKTNSLDVASQMLSKQHLPNEQGGIITVTENLAKNDVIANDINVKIKDTATSYADMSMQDMNDISTNAGKGNNTLKQGKKHKMDSLTMEAVEQHAGKTIGEAAKSLGVGRSTLKRFCREHGVSSWPVPKQSKTTIYVTSPELSKELSSEQRSSSPWFALIVVVFIVIRVKRWRNRSLNKQATLQYIGSYPSTGKPKCTTNILNTTRNMDNLLDVGMLMVKATFKNDMIKFKFPISSGLLELENEVAQRFSVKGKSLSLKYKDEDNDLVCITCDADLHALPEFSASNTTIKLIIQLADD